MDRIVEVPIEKVIIKEIPVEVDKVVERLVTKEVPKEVFVDRIVINEVPHPGLEPPTPKCFTIEHGDYYLILNY